MSTERIDPPTTKDSQGRLAAMLARLRALQLEHALAGRVVESADFASRASRVRAALEAVVTRGAAVLAAVLLAFAPALASAQPVAAVRTAAVTEQVVQDHRRVTGSLQAVSRSSVASQEAGAVERVLVNEGSAVRAGDAIATLDSRRLRATIEEAKAELANYQALVEQRTAELAFERVNHARVQRVYNQDAATEFELTERKTGVDVSEAQLRAAERLVQQTERRIDRLAIRLQDMTVRAPFDARVVARHVEPGEWIEPGQPAVTLVSTGKIEARLEVPERFAPAVMKDEFQLYVALASDGRTIPSVEVRPIPEVDPRARTFQVIVTLDNAAGDLAPGMSVEAWVPTSDQSMALLAPKDAVIRNGRDAFVYRVARGDEAQADRTAVRVLFTSGDRVALASDDLRAGDRVVVEGNERLMPGSRVASASSPAPTATRASN